MAKNISPSGLSYGEGRLLTKEEKVELMEEKYNSYGTPDMKAKMLEAEKSVKRKKGESNLSHNLSRLNARVNAAQKDARSKMAVFGKKNKGKRVKSPDGMSYPRYLKGTDWD